MLRMKEIRKNNGLSQKQLASILGVSILTINSWEMAKPKLNGGVKNNL